MTTTLYFAACIAALISASSAHAQSAHQTYPDKPLRMIVPFSAGGPVDLVGRLVGQRLTQSWGQQVVVDNRTGANGILAQEVVAKARPDGYTLMVNSTGYAINPTLYKQLPFDTNADFLPITQVVSMAQVLVVHPDLSAKSVSELVALAKAKPATLNYSSFGSGSIAHVAGELFKQKTGGIQVTHIPYKGAPPALAALFSAEVHLMLPTLGSVLPHYKAGRVRGLAVSSSKRLPLVTELPTMIEAGVPGYETTAWVGLFFPAGVSRQIVSKLYRDVAQIMASADVRSNLETQGYVVSATTPSEFKQFIIGEMDKYAAVVKAAGMKLE